MPLSFFRTYQIQYHDGDLDRKNDCLSKNHKLKLRIPTFMMIFFYCSLGSYHGFGFCYSVVYVCGCCYCPSRLLPTAHCPLLSVMQLVVARGLPACRFCTCRVHSSYNIQVLRTSIEWASSEQLLLSPSTCTCTTQRSHDCCSKWNCLNDGDFMWPWREYKHKAQSHRNKVSP